MTTVDEHGNPSDKGTETGTGGEHGAKPGAGKDNDTDKGTGDGKPAEGDGKGGDKEGRVPSGRLREVTDKNKELQSKLSAYEQKEKDEEEKKKKSQGKYEELLGEKDATIKDYETKTANLTEYEKIVLEGVEKDLGAIKTDIGEENLASILEIVGYEGKTVLEKRNLLSKIGELASKLSKSPAPSGGSAAKATTKDGELEEAKKGGFSSFINAALGSK